MTKDVIVDVKNDENENIKSKLRTVVSEKLNFDNSNDELLESVVEKSKTFVQDPDIQNAFNPWQNYAEKETTDRQLNFDLEIEKEGTT